MLVESQLPNVKKAEDDLVQELRDRSVSLTQLANEKEAATGRELQLLVEDLNELLQEVFDFKLLLQAVKNFTA